MKSEKGITLVSVTIYIIAMAIVVGIMAVLSTYFFKNVNNVVDIDPLTEYTKLNSYLTDETNHSNIKILGCAVEENGDSYIAFDNGIQYTFVKANKGIYRNKAKICRDIDKCTFSQEIQNGKTIVIVEFKAENKNETMTYTLSL